MIHLTDSYSEQLSQDTLLEMFWFMLLSRRLDERCWLLHRQGKIAFHISSIGHEAMQVAAAFAINRGVDYVFPYYRDLGLSLAIGFTPTEFMLGIFGKGEGHDSAGRQMPNHFSDKKLNVVSGSSVVATQVPQAAGAAFAINYRRKVGLVDPEDTSQPRLALTCIGEGSTSQGEWHEGLNWAGVHTLPYICLVQNNQYAISQTMDKQMATRTVSERASAYGIEGVTVDGTDVLQVYNAMRDAVERAYRGEGATLVEAVGYRMTPHSSDDDDRSYRTREEVDYWRNERDPVTLYQNQLLKEGILTPDSLKDMEEKVKAEVEKAHRYAEACPEPAPEDALGDIFAPVEASDIW